MKTLIVVVVIVVVAIVGFVFYKGSNSQPEATPTPTDEMMDEHMDEDTMMDDHMDDAMMDNVKSFEVTGAKYRFTPDEIRVKKGDTVKVTLTAGDMQHDWVVDEFNARTKVVTSGNSDTVEFVADKVGTFEFYCSVANHRQLGMVGKLIVE